MQLFGWPLLVIFFPSPPVHVSILWWLYQEYQLQLVQPLLSYVIGFQFPSKVLVLIHFTFFQFYSVVSPNNKVLNLGRSLFHHHHVALVARISLTLSRHSSLSFIALGRSSGQHPVSSHSCWMYVRAGRPASARPCVGVHKSTSLMSSSLLLQQGPACLVRLTWIVFVIGGRWPYGWCLVGVAARTYSRLLAALCNCRLASSPAVLLASM